MRSLPIELAFVMPCCLVTPHLFVILQRLLEHGESTEWHPTLRGEVAFQLVGPLQLGGFLTGTAAEPAFDGPAFGGGLLVALRPEIPVLGLTAHLEASAARMQLPTPNDGRVDLAG